MKTITDKFGSLAMLLGVAGLDTSKKILRERVGEIETSRDPVKIVIHYRSYAWVLWVGEAPKPANAISNVAVKISNGVETSLLPEGADGKRS